MSDLSEPIFTSGYTPEEEHALKYDANPSEAILDEAYHEYKELKNEITAATKAYSKANDTLSSLDPNSPEYNKTNDMVIELKKELNSLLNDRTDTKEAVIEAKEHHTDVQEIERVENSVER